MTRDHVDFQNPIIAAQTCDFRFISDPHQGHTMPTGREFIGENRHICIDEMIEDIRRTGRKAVLNIGDSSTSGWDSDVVTENRKRHAEGKPLRFAFFRYHTYSDYLRGFIGDKYAVINAGVPAHTSLQGSRRLKVLLDRFQTEGIEVQWVTVYYGNNDSVWDHNRQDKNWVGRRRVSSTEKRLRIPRFLTKADGCTRANAGASDDGAVVTRAMPNDYLCNIKEIMRTCRRFGAAPIIIEPITPIYWKPGTRVLHEDLKRREHAGSDKVYQLLDEARALWAPAVQQQSYSDLKRAALEEAREKDFVVPRIKRTHLTALREAARGAQVPYLRVNLDRTQDDCCYFVDYCHPMGVANQLIAGRIANVVAASAGGNARLDRLHLVRGKVQGEDTSSALPADGSR